MAQEASDHYIGDCENCEAKRVDCCLECERCRGGCCRCYVFGRWDYPIAWDAERFLFITQKHSDLTEFVESRTTEILKRLGHKGWLLKFDEYNITYQWNGSCHCHPSYQEATFPADWICAKDWEIKVDAEVTNRQAKERAVELKNHQMREQQERKDFERLQAKYGR